MAGPSRRILARKDRKINVHQERDVHRVRLARRIVVSHELFFRGSREDRAHGLGDNDQGRALQGTRRTSGMKEIAPANIRRDVNGWEGEQHVMQSRSIRRSGQPTWAIASPNACN
jgi:hypothetical protein